MKKLKQILISISFLFLASNTLSAQSPEILYKTGIKLKSEKKLPEALSLFQLLVKNDSSNLDYLWNCSFLLSKVGNRQPTDNRKQNYFHQAEYLAKKAIAVNGNSADAHYVYALALGRINENASNKQKIANAKLIKTECNKAIQIDPKYGGVYHILGRWHRTVTGFNVFEKAMINTFYGGVPEGGTYEDAIRCFSKAIEYEPEYKLHQYELAETYYERDSKGDKDLAKTWLQKAMALPVIDEDDKDTQTKCEVLLKKME